MSFAGTILDIPQEYTSSSGSVIPNINTSPAVLFSDSSTVVGKFVNTGGCNKESKFVNTGGCNKERICFYSE